MKTNSKLESICKMTASALGGVLLATSGPVLGIASYLYATNKINFNTEDIVFLISSATIAPILFLSGVSLEVYGLNKFKDLIKEYIN